MSTLTHNGQRPATHRDSGGLWAVLLVVTVLAVVVWGAWRLGVMAGEGAMWRRGLPEIPAALRKVPTPQPPQIPTQRRPEVEPALRD